MVAALSIPCLGVQAGDAGVIHLPVAPRCNLRCAFCHEGHDCVSDGVFGSHSQLLTAQQAERWLGECLAAETPVAAIGVSGPGDPLANPEETLATLRTARRMAPDAALFISTNGVAVAEHVAALAELPLNMATVMVNAVDPRLAERLYGWVRTPTCILEGSEAARWIIARQLGGISQLVQAGVAVRVNLLAIPGLNADHLGDVAACCAEAGACVAKLTAFVPQVGQALSGFTAADARCMQRAREAVLRHLPVLSGCAGCQADSLGCSAADPGKARIALHACARTKDDSPAPPSRPAAPAYAQLALLARIARHLSEAGDTEPALSQVLRWLAQEQELRRGVISLLNETEDEIVADISAAGVPQEAESRMRYRPGEGITGRVLATGTPVFLSQLQAEASFLERSGLRKNLDLTRLAFFCVPIRYRGNPIGTLSCDKDNRALKDADGVLAFLVEVAALLAPFVQRRRLEERLEAYQRLRTDDGRLVGRSPAIETVRRLVAKVAGVETSVLITGETGTGKGVLAQLVHDLGPRKDSPFIEVNCGAIPESLIESELFGHEKGSFTGATARRAGVFERAKGGTVFLDEIGELPASAQTRMLRVLQTRRFERVGGSETLTTDARVIAATNRDLEKAIVAGQFRSDLYYRLNVFPIHMPPLRERGKADVMLLADAFAERFAKRMGKGIHRFDTPAIDMLTAYHWPGNVRELENVIERAAVMAEDDTLHGHHLPPSLQMNRYVVKPGAGPEESGFLTRVANFEIELITEGLKDASGNQTQAAKNLGMTKRMMQYKVKLYGIDADRFR